MSGKNDEEAKRQLYESQVATLKLFLEKKAITQAQFDKSYNDLTVKMGYKCTENQ